MKVPFFRLNFNNKTSYLLGTNHFYPYFPDQIKTRILCQKNLVCESGIPKIILSKNTNVYYDYNNPVDNFKYTNSKIIINKDTDLRKFYNLNIVKLIGSYDLNYIISKQIEGYPIDKHIFNSNFILLKYILVFA